MNENLKNCLFIAEQANLSPDDLYLEAQVREDYGEFIKINLLPFSPSTLKDAARKMEKDSN